MRSIARMASLRTFIQNAKRKCARQTFEGLFSAFPPIVGQGFCHAFGKRKLD